MLTANLYVLILTTIFCIKIAVWSKHHDSIKHLINFTELND